VKVRAGALVLASAACAIGGSGCSILFAKGPPQRVERGEPIRCTRSYALPVVDGLLMALQAARTIYAFTRSDADYKDDPANLTRPVDIGIGIGFTTLHAVSMGVGVSRVGDCNELLEKIEHRAEPRRARPGNPFGPPPPTVDWDADPARARAAAAEEAKAAGEAAGASGK
jgi:hypothetical protein